MLAAEVIGGSLLILGVRVRESAAALAIVAIGATWTHGSAGWLFTNEGGGWEYPLFLAAACAVQVLLGPGAVRVTLPGSLLYRSARDTT